jgi:L-alanine-DL-glutamate epimerase-like enolase superfamily enzyme
MMRKNIQIEDIELYFLPAPLRVPLRFGAQTLSEVYCARVQIKVRDEQGNISCGWGETPLSVPWVWPSELDYQTRETALQDFCKAIAINLKSFQKLGHAFEISYDYIQNQLNTLNATTNKALPEELPHLAALVCFSAFDLALHDAYGKANNIEVFKTYNKNYLNKDLSHYLESVNGHNFTGQYPEDFFIEAENEQAVWHLVGGLDLLTDAEKTGNEPDDGYPVTLTEWIKRDQLNCLKIKLKGNNSDWDYARIVQVGEIAIAQDAEWLTTDFNCTVTNPAYVDAILDKLRDQEPRIYGMLLYVEQPFPYDLKDNKIDVHSCSSRKPLFMDESAHDWTYVKLGYSLGWTGVALKTCKTLTGALLSLCWAKAHGMTLMVQDLTNPMLAQIPHVLLAAHAGTIKGVESNGMQFYPDVSLAEQEIHPGLYQRRKGILDLSTLSGPGFGYRLDEISRQLPEAAITFQQETLNAR